MQVLACLLILSVGQSIMSDNLVIAISPPPGFTSLTVNDISDDGSTAVGTMGRTDGLALAFRWRRGIGVIPLEATERSFAYGVSRNGDVTVGYLTNGGDNLAVMWNAQGTRSFLHPNFYRAHAVTPDGRFVVGKTVGGRPCRYGDGVLTIIDADRSLTAYCVTPDGRTLAGGQTAWRWDEGAALQYVVPNFGPGQAVNAMSDDGTVLGGYHNSAFTSKAFLIRNGQAMRYYEDLGIYEVNALSGDGQIVISDGFGGGSWIGFGDGVPEPFRGYLERIGTTGLEGWTNFHAVAVSRDARFAAGNGRYQGVISGWVFSGSLRPGVRRATARPARSAQEPR
jgi:uncharacterized membrane protein